MLMNFWKMRNVINQDYLYTEEWLNVNSVRLTPNSLYIHAHDPEDRSLYCAAHLIENNPDTIFVEVSSSADDVMAVFDSDQTYPLNSQRSMERFYAVYAKSKVYIEVTGMSCRIATPLIKYAIEHNINISVIYTEPAEYRISEFQKEGLNKDLSESVDGISPLPGLISIFPDDTPRVFVALLGFEGGRFSAILQDYNPVKENVIPVVGVPGYRIEYPYATYWGNRIPLRNTMCWQKVRYAEANSIVDAFLLLDQIYVYNRKAEMVVAPIGTKPHAIGAILYALKHRDKVELIYDNPKRSVHRTHGIGKVLVCDVTKLYNDN